MLGNWSETLNCLSIYVQVVGEGGGGKSKRKSFYFYMGVWLLKLRIINVHLNYFKELRHDILSNFFDDLNKLQLKCWETLK